MALAVAEGAEGVPDTTVRLRRIAELEEARKELSVQDAYLRAQQAQADISVVTHDDLRWADGRRCLSPGGDCRRSRLHGRPRCGKIFDGTGEGRRGGLGSGSIQQMLPCCVLRNALARASIRSMYRGRLL
jgi:hypothetical protein